MKQIVKDVLRLLSVRPGITQSKAGVELSGSWGSSYTRMTISEMIHQGLIQADTSGKKGHSPTLTETGLQALQEAGADAPEMRSC